MHESDDTSRLLYCGPRGNGIPLVPRFVRRPVHIRQRVLQFAVERLLENRTPFHYCET